jgi:hypothetical protein
MALWDLEEHAGVGAEVEATAEWVTRRVLDGTLLEGRRYAAARVIIVSQTTHPDGGRPVMPKEIKVNLLIQYGLQADSALRQLDVRMLNAVSA